MAKNSSRLLMSGLALLAAAIAAPPAFADYGRGHYYGRYKHDHVRFKHARHYNGYYAPYRGGYYYHDYGRRRGRISGGEAALIAAGVIGGVILIDQALDANERRSDADRYYDDRYYARRGDRYRSDPYYRRDEHDAYDAGRRDRDAGDRAFAGEEGEDYGLAGGRSGENDRGGAQLAFRECVAEARGAASAGGLSASFPNEPLLVEEKGAGWRLEARFRATNPRGDSWVRRMICEADESAVRFLQID